jgi:4'-phosphopantetheinyl transferase
LQFSERGKPQLKNSATTFNVSHSHSAILIAITESLKIGVDVEYMNPAVDAIGIAKKYFSAGETYELQMLSGAEQISRFYEMWTDKEAHIKAQGGGIAHNNCEGLRRETTHCDTDFNARWHVFHLDIVPGYKAAAVIERPHADHEVKLEWLN